MLVYSRCTAPMRDKGQTYNACLPTLKASAATLKYAIRRRFQLWRLRWRSSSTLEAVPPVDASDLASYLIFTWSYRRISSPRSLSRWYSFLCLLWKRYLGNQCPYCNRDDCIASAASKDSKFCFQAASDGTLQLIHSHVCYYQVQTQLFVSNLDYCNFCVCTIPDGEAGLHIERIHKN